MPVPAIFSLLQRKRSVEGPNGYSARVKGNERSPKAPPAYRCPLRGRRRDEVFKVDDALARGTGVVRRRGEVRRHRAGRSRPAVGVGEIVERRVDIACVQVDGGRKQIVVGTRYANIEIITVG